MLAILIQRENKLKFYRLSRATFYNCNNAIYLFLKLLLGNKISFFFFLLFFLGNGAFKALKIFVLLI